MEFIDENDDESYEHSLEEGDQPIDAFHSIYHHAQNDNDAGVNECKSASWTQKEPATRSIDDIFIVDGNEVEQWNNIDITKVRNEKGEKKVKNLNSSYLFPTSQDKTNHTHINWIPRKEHWMWTPHNTSRNLSIPKICWFIKSDE